MKTSADLDYYAVHDDQQPVRSAVRSAQNLEPAKTSTIEIHHQVVERVIAWMHKQLGEPLSLQDMADVASLSPYHFSRIFSRITGISPFKFLATLRLQHAKELLLTTSLSATEICFEVGYSSLGNFTTQFTQAVGLSPVRFRRSSENPDLSGITTLLEFREHSLAQPAGAGSVTGRIDLPGPHTGVTFIGLYPEPIPQGMPVGWSMVSDLDRYTIPRVSSGHYWLFAAAFNWSNDPITYLLPDNQSLYVGSSQSPIEVTNHVLPAQLNLSLRQPQPTDPPLLSALPILLNQWVHHQLAS